MTDPPVPLGAVVINELMYHPVAEDADEDNHEFVELYNRSAAPVALAGWKLQGDVTFTFPATTLEPGKYVVIAKNKKALTALTKYMLDAAGVIGDYTGQLDNGSGRVALVDGQGMVVDTVSYKTKFPWPMAPDALGAGEAWTQAKWGKPETHRYMGISLERVSAEVVSTELANWAPSPIDGATPGRKNAGAGMPLPVVEALTVAPVGKAEGAIGASDKVQVTAKFSAMGAVKDVEVEFYVEDVNKAQKATTKVAMMPMGPATFMAELPAQKANSVVRYKVFADRGKGREQVAPRPSDPMDVFDYWVQSPDIPAGSYQLFISLRDWGQLFKNLEGGMVYAVPQGSPSGTVACRVNPTWDNRVPALLVAGGKVFDVRVRYAGSRWNRTGGPQIPDSRWPREEAPSGPRPLVALSWNVKLPRYDSFEGRRTVYFNKLWQSGPGMPAALGARIFTEAGFPAPLVRRFTRVYINGRYYHYMMDIEHGGEDLLKRHFSEKPALGKGELIKANSGMYGDEGPWGISDGRPLREVCNLKLADRYAATWERKNYEWRNHEALHAMFNELDAAAKAGPAQVRAFYAKHFDVDRSLTYMAIRNWQAAWDDTYHNFQLYKHPESGKWMFTPLDMDWEFGAFTFNAQSSFYLGTKGFMNRWNQWGTFKETLLLTHKAEFEKKLKELAAGVLAPANVTKLLDEEAKKYDVAAARAAPAGVVNHPAGISNNIETSVSNIKRFVRDRDAEVKKLP
jgi:hypothetical protein